MHRRDRGDRRPARDADSRAHQPVQPGSRRDRRGALHGRGLPAPAAQDSRQQTLAPPRLRGHGDPRLDAGAERRCHRRLPRRPQPRVRPLRRGGRLKIG